LSPGVRHPAHVEDAAAAFAWVKRNIAGWGGDARRVFVAGYSAGGYLAALLGADERYLRVHDLSSADIAGLILIAATFDLRNRPSELKAPWGSDPKVWEDASPARHFGPHVPRTLMIIGGRDEPWRLRDHAAAAVALRTQKVDISHEILAGRTHTTVRGAPGEEPAEPGMAEILAFLMRPSTAGGDPGQSPPVGKAPAEPPRDAEGRTPYAHGR
jgi:acetyl esterase/lipase